MSISYELGKTGEDEAAAYLIREGYTILERNWRFAKAEIDIIASKGEWLVMTEVKTRQNSAFGDPEEFVSRTKQRHLIRAANRYADLYATDQQIRFDIIAIIIEPQFKLHHIEEAFYP